MVVNGKIVVVTGAAAGIGKAMAERFAAEGAAHVVVADLNLDAARNVAKTIGGSAQRVDVAVETDLQWLIATTEERIGPIDLFCSNAGILVSGGMNVSNRDWLRAWNTNVMSLVWAARNLIPGMLRRGGGYLLHTASAAGLLNQIDSAPYGVTKHAAVGLAEWISITYGDQGIGVSLLCPQAVRTGMIRGLEDHVASVDGVLEPEKVAQSVLDGLAAEQFLILPHSQVAEYFRRKAENYDRWLGGMRKLHKKYSRI